MKKNTPKILISAYAVNPYKGSEDGTAWNMVIEIAKYNNVLVITRENNQAAIEKYRKENALPQGKNLEFAYFDLPYWMRFWKKGGRGALLYFYLWQIGMLFFVKKKKFQFDIAHNLNFHNDWTPSFLWALGKPFVWGPIGHHPRIPKLYLMKSANKAAYYLDGLKWFTKKCFWWFDPFLKITKWKAAKIITINSSVQKELGFSQNKEIRLPAVATRPAPEHIETLTYNMFNILSIGRFVPLKGFDITIEAFAKFYHRQTRLDQNRLKLTLIGKGPEKERLEKLTKIHRVESAVEFVDWMSRSELDTYFSSCSVFLFPSHEGAGMVVPEALSFGLPVLCFDNIGPGEFIDGSCGMKVGYTTPRDSIVSFSKYLQLLFKEPALQKRLSAGAKRHFENNFTWERKGEIISEAYREILFGKEKSELKKLDTKIQKSVLIF